MMREEYLHEARKWLHNVKMLADKQKDDDLYHLRLNVLEWLINQAERNSSE